MNLSALAKSFERLSEADAVVADRYLHHTLQGLAVNVLAGVIGVRPRLVGICGFLVS